MRFFHLKEQAVGLKPAACSFKTNGVFLGEEHPPNISELFQYHDFSLREIYYLCVFNPVINE